MKRKIFQRIVAAAMITAAMFYASSCQLVSQAPSDTSSVAVVLPSQQTTEAEESTAKQGFTEREPLDTDAETTERNPSEAPVVKTYINPLTGNETTLDPSGLRPVAVVVDNARQALAHQTGLDAADVLYETLVAPGITRFLAIYSDYRAADEICNVRAGKVHDVKIAAAYNAVLICHGGHSDINSEYDFSSATKELFGSENAYIDTKTEPAWSAQIGDKLGTVKYYTDVYRTDLKYDTVVTPEAIEYTSSQKKYSAFASSGHTVEGEARAVFDISGSAPEGSSAQGVIITFTASGVYSPLEKNVSFKYSSADGKYLRFEDSSPHIDAASGKQLTFDNLIVLSTDVKYIAGDSDVDPLTTSVSVYGSGTGYYFSSGRYVTLVWVNTAEEGLKLYSSDGEMKIVSGNTYVGYVDRSNASAVKISE